MNNLFKLIFKTVPSTSEANTVNKTDVYKAGRTALLVGLTSAVSYVITNLAGLDLGQYSETILPVIAFGLDFLYRWLKDNTPKE